MRIRLTTPELVILSLATGALCYQLLLPPIVGLTDNGDFGRIIGRVGLQSEVPPDPSGGYITRSYIRVARYDWSGYDSSELLITTAATTVNRLVSKDDRFDLRVLGVVHLLLLLVGLATILLGLRPLGRARQWIIGSLLLVVFVDVAYVSYLNTFYSEPASLVFLLATIGIGIWGVTHRPSGGQRIALLCAFTGLAALLVISKPQHALLALPLAIIAYRLATPTIGPAPPVGRWSVLGLSCATFLIVASFTYLQLGLPDHFRTANLYNLIFAEILPHSASPARDLEQIGLDSSLTSLAGTTVYTPGNRYFDPATRAALLADVDHIDIVRFYLGHPRRFLDLAGRASSNTGTLRPPYLGNFEQSSGLPPYYQSRAFDWWSTIRERHVPWGPLPLTIFLGGNAIVAILRWWCSPKASSQHGMAELHLAVVSMAVMQFLSVLLGEGEYELVKHLFLFNALLDLCLVFLALAALDLCSKHLPQAWARAG